MNICPALKFIFLIFLGLHVFNKSICATALEISPQDPAFSWLRSAQSRSQQLLGTQHFPQNVGSLKASLNTLELTPFEKYQLENRHPFGGSPLIQWKDSVRNHSLTVSPLIFAAYSDSGGSSFLGGPGLRMYGQLGPSLSFFTSGRVYTEKSSDNIFKHQFDPDYGETCSVESTPDDGLLDTRTCALFEYYLLMDLGWIDFRVGRDQLHMGPGYFSSLTANRDTPPYYFAEARIDFADWLQIDNYFLKMVDSDHNVRKWAHIHRFEFQPLKSLSLAFQDAVIYQGREPDMAYFIPLVPLAFAEDNGGGRDNDAMSFDFLYTGLPYFSVWGELFIDDLLGPTSFFDDFWENRWAALAGFQVVSPWPQVDADLVVEVSRVEPWTYVGRGSNSDGETFTSFKHFNVPSASAMGPNSQYFNVQLSYRPFPQLEWIEGVKIREKGTDPGSDLETVHNNADHGTKKEFLGANTISTQTYQHGFRFFWMQYLASELTIAQTFGDTSQTKVSVMTELSW